MALKAVHVSDVPKLDQVPENVALSLCSFPFTKCLNEGGEDTRKASKFPKFVVIGHRGRGMNMLQYSDQRMKFIKENSILSFNSAAKLPLDYLEFDVQVTKDDFPVIFHDNFISTEHEGAVIEKRVTGLTLDEFLSYGPQKETGKVGKPLLRKLKDGRIFEWKVEQDAPICTLQEVFQEVDNGVGFNIELKFDDQIVYKEKELTHVLQAILQVVFEHAKDRPILFSSFQPDAALLMRKLQRTYPVLFLTNGGTQIYTDTRRNSLDEAIKVCIEGDLQGIVSEVRAVFRNPRAVRKIKKSKLSLVTYGQLNNVPEVVYLEYLMGIEGVIVDLVEEITDAVSAFIDTAKAGEEWSLSREEKEGKVQQVKTKSPCSRDELAVLLKLISELAQP